MIKNLNLYVDEYLAHDFKVMLTSTSMVQSVNRRRRMTDNARMESQNNSMKSGMYHRQTLESGYLLRSAIVAMLTFTTASGSTRHSDRKSPSSSRTSAANKRISTFSKEPSYWLIVNDRSCCTPAVHQSSWKVWRLPIVPLPVITTIGIQGTSNGK